MMKSASGVNNTLRLILLGLCLVSFSLFAAQFKTTMTKRLYSRQFSLQSADNKAKRSPQVGGPSQISISPVGDTAPFPTELSPLDPAEAIIAAVLGGGGMAFSSSAQCLATLNGQNALFLGGFLAVNSLGNLNQQLSNFEAQYLLIPEFFGQHPVTWVQTVLDAQANPSDEGAQTGAVEVTIASGQGEIPMTIQIGFVSGQLIMTLFNGHGVNLGSVNSIPVAVAEYLSDSSHCEKKVPGSSETGWLKDTFQRPFQKPDQSRGVSERVSYGRVGHYTASSTPAKQVAAYLLIVKQMPMNETDAEHLYINDALFQTYNDVFLSQTQ